MPSVSDTIWNALITAKTWRLCSGTNMRVTLHARRNAPAATGYETNRKGLVWALCRCGTVSWLYTTSNTHTSPDAAALVPFMLVQNKMTLSSQHLTILLYFTFFQNIAYRVPVSYRWALLKNYNGTTIGGSPTEQVRRKRKPGKSFTPSWAKGVRHFGIGIESK